MDVLDWFASDAFMPHGHCYLWRPSILWLHVGSDAVIAAAYFSIPLALVTFVRRRRDLAFEWIFVLFGAFILLCGLTHAAGIWTTWQPNYAIEGLVKAATAAVSITTAILLWPLLPRAVRLPSPQQLAEANQRYRELNAELESRVQQRTRDLEKAVEQRDLEVARQRQLAAALARSNDDLGRFASFLSHELRQPLQTATLAAALLRETPAAPDAESAGSLARLERALGGMRDLIEAELALARLGRSGDAWTSVSLEEAAHEARQQLELDLEAVGARVEIGPLPGIEGNATQMRQLFANLLSNALRYRRLEVPLRVVIRARSGDGRVRIQVEDNGRGFPAEVAAQLFDPFERAGAAEGQGVGVGLAICRRIVERHGGRIEADGRVGEGARFVVELPLEAAPHQRPARFREETR